MSGLDPLLDPAAFPDHAVPEASRSIAHLSLMDWMTCARAGVAEPVAVILRGLASSAGGAPQAALPGGGRAPARMAAPDGPWLLDAMKYKLHACCNRTHAMIEALRGWALGKVAAVHLRTTPRWLSVRDINVPRTGLEVKLSHAWLAGMVLCGDATGSDRISTDAPASLMEAEA